LPLLGFVRQAVWPPLPALAPALGVAWLLAEWHPITGFLWIFLGGTVSAGVYYAAFWWTGLTADEREQIAGKVRGRLHRRGAGAA
jgi:hypothetical protein